ncbi:MAG TPA: GNAT family N-acetyltransferase [Casimicrobiaceae bacterium]|nr:GNAT family N-acetyltransferase [Casimicrobiaceae bacterium]
MSASGAAAMLRHAETPADIALARELFVEYARWLAVDLCFQGFESELATLPGTYAPPRGRLLLAGLRPAAFGCIALRPLEPQSACCGGIADARGGNAIGEVKRLYVQPAHRGEGWGRRLAEALIAEARAIGYRELKLDTLDWMDDARKLYAKIGFRECPAYYENPLPGVVYMALAL